MYSVRVFTFPEKLRQMRWPRNEKDVLGGLWYRNLKKPMKTFSYQAESHSGLNQ